ncbi:6,7-dimethyl-8-ribityllumazine synthase [Pelomicrobium methylotrophicum]|uniref:6,7-dimethyl-8-ribityllumazine synthase n=1 Tax=Pelomicrobium methylotrophicum TaxID=2602750 RepID=A0A5C7ETN3_9PROT|nr:6,7-dimethyl-8-ribityllumazine synthase [Pelomicrobium methylotrophicum]TXF10717.1 6,7-dimethyl-8-ribityllumazine synthase [Pelomicrobium methylotrophicum]
MAQHDNILQLTPELSGAGLRIGVVMSRFNSEVSEALLSACTAELRERGVAPKDVLIVTVPGALEIPVALQKLALTGKYDALIALGAVIRGETYHFEVVANESAAGIMSVQLDTGIPIANGVLTTDNEDQAMRRTAQKGKEAAQVAIEMANLLRRIV